MIARAEYASQSHPLRVTPILLGAGAFTLLTSNPLLSASCVAVLALVWHRVFGSPFLCVIAANLTYQWSQISMKVWLADAFLVDLSFPQELSWCEGCTFVVTSTTGEAVFLGLVAIVMTSVGARLLAPRPETFRAALPDLSPVGLFGCYFFLLLVSRVASTYIGGALAQPIGALGSVRLSFTVLLALGWLTQRRGLPLLSLVVGIELVLGLGGFFSSGFTAVFFAIGVGVLCVLRSHWRRIAPVLVVSVPALILLGSVWTAVKPAYRKVLNQGTATQTVQIDMSERLSTLGNLSGGLGKDELSAGLVGLALRLSYVDFLAEVLARIPAVQPHEYGEVWYEAIYHVLTPRFLFPDKPALPSDSERTMRFTGRELASDAQGTSISIGYVGECYIDFGIPGIVAIPFLMGLCYGFIARRLTGLAPGGDALIVVALMAELYSPVRMFESSNIKFFPGLLWNWIVFSGFLWLVWPQLRPSLMRVRERVLRNMPDPYRQP